MFILGICTGILLVSAPKVIHRIINARDILGSWAETISFVRYAIVVSIQQQLSHTVVYDSDRRAYKISFCLKGVLHQIYATPQTGPLLKNNDPVALGYASIVPLYKWNR